MMWWGDEMGWGAGWFSWLFMAGFWVLVILGIVLVIRSLSGDRGQSHPPPGPHGAPPSTPPGVPPGGLPGPAPGPGGRSPALAILEERYARGEIDREEFLQRKADLQG